MSNSSSTTTTSATIKEYDLPPYDACVKSSYTKKNIEEFKKQLESIEEELLSIKSNDIKKPQLRRQAADLEEIIINFENTEPKPEIIQSLNDNIELLNEYVELEKNNILSNTQKFFEDNLNSKVFRDDIECPFRHYFDNNTIIGNTDIKLIIDYLKNRFPIYSNAFEIYCNETFKELFLRTSDNHKIDLFLSQMKHKTSVGAKEAIKRRSEIKTYIDETQLNFNKRLSSFIENIIDEKKQIENKITELERKVNKLIKNECKEEPSEY
jgi:hypothetical protein